MTQPKINTLTPGPEDLKALFDAQQKARWRVAATGVEERKAKLKRLTEKIRQSEEAICAAIYKDFGKHPHESAITEQDAVALGIDTRKITLFKGAVLVKESMIRRHQHVSCVGGGEFADDGHQFLQRLLYCFEHPFFRVPLVTGGIDTIVINVHNVVFPEQRPVSRFAFPGHGQ